MKSVFFKSLAIMGLVTLTAPQQSHAAMADNVMKVMNTIGKSNSSIVCRKGDAFKQIFSLRSFEGQLCKDPMIAAYAVINCRGVLDFDGSTCDKNSAVALKGRDPAMVLQEGLQKGITNARGFVCANAAKQTNPNIQKMGAKFCPKANAGAATQAPMAGAGRE